jgi:hypothetical protein
MKTDLEELDEFLVRAGNVKGVGIRKKIVIIRQWLDSFIKRKKKKHPET